jgi:hypothetical protein
MGFPVTEAADAAAAVDSMIERTTRQGRAT